MSALLASCRGSMSVRWSVLVLAVGCASFHPVSQEDAIAAALQNVCGTRLADSTCTVRGMTPVRGGYRVVVDRRLSAGHDRLAVVVRRGGHVDVTPMDTVAAIK